jgi:hypothetical protein
MLLQKKSAKKPGAAPTCKMSMARTSANYIGPSSTYSLISMVYPHQLYSYHVIAAPTQNYKINYKPGTQGCDKHHCKSVPAQSQIWHTMWQSCLKWRTISHMWSIFCFTCVIYASPFFRHMVCQIRLKWSQQRIIVKHILHNMCQMWLCAGARFTVIVNINAYCILLLKYS